MEKFKFLKKGGISQIPRATGVYAFLNKKGGLYIGKATNLRERIKNHFQQPHSLWEQTLLRQGFGGRVGFIKTNSEIEALILEAKLIKKYQPKYNVLWRDDKNYFYVAITKEDFPRIFITHQLKIVPTSSRILDEIGKNCKLSRLCRGCSMKSAKINYIGPFVEGAALKKTLRTLRKVFPYYTKKTHPKGHCPWCHLLLCPGPDPDRQGYQKSIKNLISILKGRRKSTLMGLKQEMKKTALAQDYEGAAKIRDRIGALEKVMSHAKVFTGLERELEKQKELEKKLKKILKTEKPISRIEAYDVSNIQGQLATGAMVTFINGIPDKNFYRKFKVKIAGKPNDIAMLKEILTRRFKHPEWEFPDLILIDGGIAQFNTALKILNRHKSAKSALINVLALAKRKNELYIENRKKPVLLKSLPREVFNLILQLRDEAHRFAISYHKKLRLKDLA